MEISVLKWILCVFVAIGAIVKIVYCIIFEQDKVINIFHDENVQKGFDILAISFYSYFTYLKVFCNGMDVHTIFESIFFYVGGFLTMAWGVYRVLAQIEDYKTKKSVRKFQKDVFDEANRK